MARTTIDHLIINSPYEEPKYYWSYDRESRTFDKKTAGGPPDTSSRHKALKLSTTRNIRRDSPRQ